MVQCRHDMEDKLESSILISRITIGQTQQKSRYNWIETEITMSNLLYCCMVIILWPSFRDSIISFNVFIKFKKKEGLVMCVLVV